MPAIANAKPAAKPSARAAKLGLCLLPLMASGLWGCIPFRSDIISLNVKVQPGSRPGLYVVSGQSNLPDGSRINVQGLRPLVAKDSLGGGQGSGSTEASNRRFSILARTLTEVKDGRWETTLNLWQTDASGQYREFWQLDSQQAALVEALPEVVFSATTRPSYVAQGSDRNLDDKNRRPEQGVIGYTDGGEWYLQAKANLPVALPVGKGTSRSQPINDMGLWVNNTVLDTASTSAASKAQPPALVENPDKPPLSPEQRFR